MSTIERKEDIRIQGILVGYPLDDNDKQKGFWFRYDMQAFLVTSYNNAIQEVPLDDFLKIEERKTARKTSLEPFQLRDYLNDDFVLYLLGGRRFPPLEKKKEVIKPQAKEVFDLITKPAHYAEGRRFEPIDVIEDWKLCHHKASAVAYISRAGRKEGEPEEKELEKAIWYLQRRVKFLREQEEAQNQQALPL